MNIKINIYYQRVIFILRLGLHNFLDVLNYITSRHFNATTLNLHQICKKISINFKNMLVVVGWGFKLKIAVKYKI